MSFYSYEGVSDDVLDKVHTTSTGETYTLRHSESLKVEMQYLGRGNSNANSQGWERNSAKYFDSLYQNHPEMFSKKNAARVKDGHAPIVDAKMIAHNPGWAQYRNQPLVHHHIGGDGEAVAIPKNAHKGQGEIHNHEKAAGITDNCKSFSKTCGSQSDSVGKTTSQLHAQIDGNKNGSSAQNSRTQSSSSTNKTSNNTGIVSKTGSREAAVRDSIPPSNNTYSANERGDSVRTATSSSSHSASGDRSEAVKNSLNSGNTSGHSLRVDSETTAKLDSVSKNYNSKKSSNSKTEKAGGRERGDEGPGRQGREPGYKSGNNPIVNAVKNASSNTNSGKGSDRAAAVKGFVSSTSSNGIASSTAGQAKGSGQSSGGGSSRGGNTSGSGQGK